MLLASLAACVAYFGVLQLSSLIDTTVHISKAGPGSAEATRLLAEAFGPGPTVAAEVARLRPGYIAILIRPGQRCGGKTTPLGHHESPELCGDAAAEAEIDFFSWSSTTQRCDGHEVEDEFCGGLEMLEDASFGFYWLTSESSDYRSATLAQMSTVQTMRGKLLHPKGKCIPDPGRKSFYLGKVPSSAMCSVLALLVTNGKATHFTYGKRQWSAHMCWVSTLPCGKAQVSPSRYFQVYSIGLRSPARVLPSRPTPPQPLEKAALPLEQVQEESPMTKKEIRTRITDMEDEAGIPSPGVAMFHCYRPRAVSAPLVD